MKFHYELVSLFFKVNKERPSQVSLFCNDCFLNEVASLSTKIQVVLVAFDKMTDKKRRQRRKQMTEADRLEAFKLSKDGWSHREIGNHFGRNHVTIGNLLKKIKEHRTVRNLPTTGRPKVLTDRQARTVLQMVKRNRSTTIREIQESLLQSYSKQVSRQTISRILHNHGMYSGVKAKKPKISERNRKKRLQYAKEMIKKSDKFWKKVIWSDESKFELQSRRRQTIWIRRGHNEKFKQSFIKETVKFPGKINVWGCFSWKGLGQLVEIEGNLDAKQFCEILTNNLQLSAHLMGLGNSFIFQQDNDPKHTSRLANYFFSSNKIKKLEHPPQSPDLNPIEHLWDEVDRRVTANHRWNIKLYRKRLFEVWEEMRREPTKYQKLIKNMKKRLQAVINAKGGNTSY